VKRPPIITTFAILNLVYAAYMVGSVVASLGSMAILRNFEDNPAFAAYREHQADYAAVLKIVFPLRLIGAVLLGTAGLGVLKMKPWARPLCLAFAIYEIGVVLANLILTYEHVVRPAFDRANSQSGPEALGATMGTVGGLMGACLGLVYPIIVLVLATRPSVTAALCPRTSPPPLPPA
jgi:uncharacterized membrane protein (DUF485 family)